MQDTLFPEYFIDQLQKFAGTLGIPLQLVKRLVLLQSPELLEHIRQDQESGLLKKYSSRYGDRERGSGGPSAMEAEVLLYLVVARAFNHDCFGERGYRSLIENSSLQHVFACLEMTKFPGRSTIHEHLGFLRFETLEAINKMILEAVKKEGIDDFACLTIDSTAISSVSTWPIDSDLLYRLFEKPFNIIEDIINLRLKEKGMKTKIERLPFKRAQNNLATMREHVLVIAFSKNKKGSRQIRTNEYIKLLTKAENLWVFLGDICDRLDKDTELDKSILNEFESAMKICNEKLYFVQKRFKMAEEADMGYMEPELLLSLSDTDACFIKKGGRETYFGYRPNFGISAHGFISSFSLEIGNTSDSKSYIPTLEHHISQTGITPMLVNTDDGYTSKLNEEIAIDKGVGMISFSGSKGRKLHGEELWHEEAYSEARRMRSSVEATISHLKCDFKISRMTVGGIDAVRKELMIRIIGFNLENLGRRLREKAKLEKLTNAA